MSSSQTHEVNKTVPTLTITPNNAEYFGFREVTVTNPHRHPRRIFQALQHSEVDRHIALDEVVHIAYYLAGVNQPSDFENLRSFYPDIFDVTIMSEFDLKWQYTTRHIIGNRWGVIPLPDLDEEPNLVPPSFIYNG